MESTEDTVLTTNPSGVLDGLPPLISVPLAAEKLGLKKSTAYRYAKIGAKLRMLIEEGEEAA
jgi:hypothetical protein